MIQTVVAKRVDLGKTKAEAQNHAKGKRIADNQNQLQRFKEAIPSRHAVKAVKKRTLRLESSFFIGPLRNNLR
jgi:hypothetical protein